MEGYRAVVTEADGKVVSEYEFTGQSTAINVSDYVAGSYTVQVRQHGKMIFVTKFVKI